MKFVPNRLYERLSGADIDQSTKEGSVLMWNPRAGHVRRQYVIPSNPDTTYQQAVRDSMSITSNAFQTLDLSEAEAWNNAANAINETDQLGVGYKLSGIALFTRINYYRQLAGIAIQTIVPDLTVPVTPLSLVDAYINAGPPLSWAPQGLATSNAADDMFLCKISNSLPGEARKARIGDCKLSSGTGSENILTKAEFEAGSTNITLENSDIAELFPHRVGVVILPLSASYVPGKPLFVSNIGMQP